MKMKEGNVATLAKDEGLERPSFLVTVFGATMMQFRCHTVGMHEGHPFFDTVDDIRVEFFNNPQFMVQTPSKGMTFDENLRYRELRKEESLIVQ